MSTFSTKEKKYHEVPKSCLQTVNDNKEEIYCEAFLLFLIIWAGKKVAASWLHGPNTLLWGAREWRRRLLIIHFPVQFSATGLAVYAYL